MKFYEAWNKFERYFAGATFLLLVFAGFIQVVFRYAFHIAVAWADELILFCLVWCVFMGSSVATVDRKHIIISALVDVFPPKLAKYVTIFSQFVWLAASVVIGYVTWTNAIVSLQMGSKTLGGKFPYWVAMIAIPIGLILMAIKVAVLIVHTFKGERDTRTAEEELMEELEDMDL